MTASVAPFESCIGCMKGDTQTGLAIEGSREFHTASLVKLADVPFDEAKGVAIEQGERGEYVRVYRLCRDCAAKSGTRVVGLAGEVSLPGYREREMFPDGLPDETEGGER